MDELEQYRQELDGIDRELVALFARRMDTVGKIGAYKKARGMQIQDRSREQKVLQSRGDMAPQYRTQVEQLYEKIMELARNAEK